MEMAKITDEFFEQAKQLAPCCEEYRYVKAHGQLCVGDKYQNDIAAVLREAAKQKANIFGAYENACKMIIDLRAEIEQLRLVISQSSDPSTTSQPSS